MNVAGNKEALLFHAVSASSGIMEIISQDNHGRVHGIFSSCLNLITSREELIAISRCDMPPLPYCLFIDYSGELGFDHFGIRKDMEVIIAPQSINIPEAGIMISLENIQVYEVQRKPIAPARNSEEIRRNLHAAWQTVREKGADEGLGRECAAIQNLRREIKDEEYAGMTPLCRWGVWFLKELIGSIEENNIPQMKSSLKGLIGLGIGLTPSADDVIAGIACGLYLAGGAERSKDFIGALSSFLKADGRTSTTLVSRISLRHIVRKEMSDAIYNMVRSILIETEKEVAGNTEKVDLKKLARRKGLLMMGPSCGLAFLNKVAIGLASKVKSGPIGLVGASGSGMQEVMAIVDRAGMGISQAIGTGGRDLTDEVGGITMIQGINILEADEETKVIVLVSKPPGRKTVDLILREVKNCKKPVVINFIGGDGDTILKAGATPAVTFEETAYKAMSMAKNEPYMAQNFSLSEDELKAIITREVQDYSPEQRYLRGIYCGGTLAEEAMMVMREKIGAIYSNAPLAEELRLKDPFASFRNSMEEQKKKLLDAGVLIMPNNAQAARLAGTLIAERGLTLKKDCHE